MWDRWWGRLEGPSGDGIVDADAISSAHIGVTRRCVEIVWGYDEMYWPGCHEDLDLCARLRLAGFRIVVDRGLPIRQRTSVTMEKVLGPRRRSLCRSTGVLYAATNYPWGFAIARVLEAIGRILSSDLVVRRGDAQGLLRCARNWPRILRARRLRRRLRRSRG